MYIIYSLTAAVLMLTYTIYIGDNLVLSLGGSIFLMPLYGALFLSKDKRDSMKKININLSITIFCLFSINILLYWQHIQAIPVFYNYFLLVTICLLLNMALISTVSSAILGYRERLDNVLSEITSKAIFKRVAFNLMFSMCYIQATAIILYVFSKRNIYLEYGQVNISAYHISAVIISLFIFLSLSSVKGTTGALKFLFLKRNTGTHKYILLFLVFLLIIAIGCEQLRDDWLMLVVTMVACFSTITFSNYFAEITNNNKLLRDIGTLNIEFNQVYLYKLVAIHMIIGLAYISILFYLLVN